LRGRDAQLLVDVIPAEYHDDRALGDLKLLSQELDEVRGGPAAHGILGDMNLQLLAYDLADCRTFGAWPPQNIQDQGVPVPMIKR